MAGSYYDAFLIDELDSDASAMVEPYAYEVFIPAEILGDGSAVALPVVTLVSPPVGTPLRAGDAAVYDVTSDTPFSLVAFRVRLGVTLPAEQQQREAAYDRDDPAGAWDPRYAGSELEQLSATHYRLTLRRATWPGGGIGILPRVTNPAGAAT